MNSSDVGKCFEFQEEWVECLLATGNPESFQKVITDLMATKKVAYQTKVEIMMRVLNTQISTADPLLILSVQTLGKLRAKRAIPIFENFCRIANEELLLAILRACSLISDKKAVQFVRRLYEHRNPKIVAAAVHTMAELSHGLIEIIHRLNLFRRSNRAEDIVVKVAIVSTLVHTKSSQEDGGLRSDSAAIFFAWVLALLYEQERHEAVRIEIIKMISHIPSRQTIKLLLNVLENKTRENKTGDAVQDEALWSFARADISKHGSYLLQRFMKSNEKLQLIILRRLARPHSLIKHYKKLGPMIKAALIESVSQITAEHSTDSSWVDQWLLERFKKEDCYLVGMIFIVCLLKRKSVGVELIIHESQKKDPLYFKTILAFLSTTHNAAEIEHALKRIRPLFKHAAFSKNFDSDVRYLYLQLRLLSAHPNITAIWDDVIAEGSTALIALIASSAQDSPLLFHLVIDELIVREGKSGDLPVLLSMIKTTDWNYKVWFDVQNKIAAICFRKSVMQTPYRNLAAFLELNRVGWLKYIDQYVCEVVSKNHPEYASFYVINKNVPLTSETVLELIDSLYGDVVTNKKALILMLLSLNDLHIDGIVMDYILDSDKSDLRHDYLTVFSQRKVTEKMI